MWMFDGQEESQLRLKGNYREYSFKDDKVSDDQTEFLYGESEGFKEEMTSELNGDYFVSTSGLVIITYANLPFKANDVVVDQEGVDYIIKQVTIEPDPNFYRSQWADRRKFQKKTLVIE